MELHPGFFTPRKIALVTHWIGGWVGPRAGLDAFEKTNPLPLSGIETRFPAVQLLSHHYIDWAIPDRRSLLNILAFLNSIWLLKLIEPFFFALNHFMSLCSDLYYIYFRTSESSPFTARQFVTFLIACYGASSEGGLVWPKYFLVLTTCNEHKEVNWMYWDGKFSLVLIRACSLETE
jgi:hypothetical protein